MSRILATANVMHCGWHRPEQLTQIFVAEGYTA